MLLLLFSELGGSVSHSEASPSATLGKAFDGPQHHPGGGARGFGL